MILLKLISWQYFRKHVVRSLLTVAGIVLGVAVFVGMHAANQSVLYAFRQTVTKIAGATQLQISAGDSGFDESVLDRVQAVPGVRVAAPAIEAVVNTGLRGQGNILILGVDMVGDRGLRDYDFENGDEDVIDDPLVFLAQPDSIIVTDTFAKRNGLTTGSKLPLTTMEGRRIFTVRGIMKPGGLASAYGGNLAVMDIYNAEKVFGRGRRFDRIDVAVKDGQRVEDVQRRIQAALGSGFTVEQPSARGEQFESVSRIYSLSANITSAFALFIGMFIIYNTFSIAVTQRRSEIGILRALGASRAQIRALFLGESLLTGIIGAALGIGFGILIARGLTGYISGYLGEVYGVAAKAEAVSTDPVLIGFALTLGIIASVVAALIPARNAAAVDPVKALQKGGHQLVSESENRRRQMLAAIAIAGALVCMMIPGPDALLFTSDALAMVAALLLTPTLSHWLSRALRPILRAARPVEGTLAADSLIQAPRRTSGTVAALMLSLALVVSLGGMARASYISIRHWLDSALNPDLFVTTSQSLTAHSFLFAPSVGEGLRQIPGIAEVQPIRNARVRVAGTPIMIVTGDVRSFEKWSRVPFAEGDPRTAYDKTAEGAGVMASENFALLHGYHLGDIVDIPSPRGNLRLPIVGIVPDYSDQQGSIIIDRSVWIRNWNDDRVNVYRIYLQRGATEDQVRSAILQKFGGQQRLFVLKNKDVRAYVLRLTDQWFGITYVQIAVAVLVAVLGIVNALTVSITDRRRELGVLQAVGGLRNQIRHTVWLEAIGIGAIGLALGIGIGAVQLWYSLEISRRDIAGIRLGYNYPIGIMAALLPVIIFAAWLSAIGPAESAVRGSLVEALEYE
ncbi:MAG TPA: FtsX-like permease family protein [Bryobacteraceae bacterium]|nr:FtsX-like permease family protein [Bryobacteraceae bacterium]